MDFRYGKKYESIWWLLCNMNENKRMWSLAARNFSHNSQELKLEPTFWFIDINLCITLRRHAFIIKYSSQLMDKNHIDTDKLIIKWFAIQYQITDSENMIPFLMIVNQNRFFYEFYIARAAWLSILRNFGAYVQQISVLLLGFQW